MILLLLCSEKQEAGKTFIGNRLAINVAGENIFEECSHDDSCTHEIAWRTSFNQEKVAGVPGYLTTEGPELEKKQQPAFVDFVKGKTVRAILLIYTDECKVDDDEEPVR